MSLQVIENINVNISVLFNKSSVLLLVIVERSRLCLDFTLTMLLLHLLLVSVYNGAFPSGSWWIVFILGGAITFMFADFLCSRQEILPITIANDRSLTRKDSTVLGDSIPMQVIVSQ